MPCCCIELDGFFITTVTLPCVTVSFFLLNLSAPFGSALRCAVVPDAATPAPLTASPPATTATAARLPALPRLMGPPLGSDRRYARVHPAVRSVRCGDAIGR